MTDKEFQLAMDGLVNGDKRGLKYIYDHYAKLIYAVVYDVVRRREDAEDITSEFFIKLIRVASTFKKGSAHKTWLVTIARNMAIDFIRKNNREVLEFDNENSGESVIEKQSDSTGANAVEEKAVLAEDMRLAMKTLSPKEKEVVDLKLVGQLKFKEIAQITGQPMGTVTWLYNQGISKLRRCLSSYENG